jgi:phosphatidylserine/phosphatidylglycerophosphate/cardiolipin synthase-like enzyme
MTKWRLLWLSLFITTSSFGNVTAYFNHNQNASYTDPYRKINRRGDNLEEVLLKEIALAKKSIYIAVQELRLPLISQALIEKKNEGVDVRVVLENSYNFTVLAQKDTSVENDHDASRLTDLKAFVDTNKNGKFEKSELETRDAVYMLQQAKIPVIDDRSDASNGSGLMHHKFMIVDGKSTVVSTANFTMSCIHGDLLATSSRGNSNSMILVQSTNFAKIFNDEFAQLWGNGKRGNFGQRKTYRGPMITTVKGIKITIQFSPTSQRHNWEDSVNGLIGEHIAKAKQSIKALLFVFSDQKLASVMEARRNAGAEIGVIIEKNFANRDYSELLDLMGLEMPNNGCRYEADNHPWKNKAQEAGMAVLPNGDVLHHKFAVIDRKTVIVGSQNWSDAANYINDETLLVIENTQIAEQYGQEYALVKRSALLGPSSSLKEQIKRAETHCADKGIYP